MIEIGRASFLEEVFLSNAMRDSLVIRKGRPVFIKGETPQESKWIEALKEDFWYALQSKLGILAKSYYDREVTQSSHIENIKQLVELSQLYSACLNGDHLVFGRAQKALNLYLKYLWCADPSVRPTHCPFDYIVIGKLKLPAGCEHRWTYADKEETYRDWVTAATNQKKDSQSLAEWELELWAGAQAKIKAAQTRRAARLNLPSAKLAESSV